MFELQEGEKIVQICRRHWLVFFFGIFRIVILMILILAIPFFLNFFWPEFQNQYLPLIWLAVALLFECLWIVLFLVVMDYYLDTWFITNQRLIFIELKGIFNRTVSSVNLINIQDVSTEVKGIIPTLIGYGNIIIQSAGTAGLFTFRQVSKPYEVKDLILHTRETALLKEKGRL